MRVVSGAGSTRTGVWVLRHIRRDDEISSIVGYSDDALEVLRRRYAAGEIDDKEFEHRRSELSR